MKLTNEEIKALAINIVKEEVNKYDEPLFFVTEKVAFQMRELIRKLRKNYWGVFDTGIKDPVTQKDRLWVPLTRLIVDTVRKNSDLDSKDTNVFARTKKGTTIAKVIRNFIRGWQEITYFGEVINDTILDLCIDGTVVWKTFLTYRDGKWRIDRRDVDLLNIYIDPNAESIQSAYRFTERALITPDEVAAMDWQDNQNVKPAKNLHRVEKDLTNTVSVGEYVDVYEMWGKIPESLITGQRYKTKSDPLVDGHIIVSGIESGDMRVHLIEKNRNRDKDGNIIKPYEEARFIKVRNRWYGVGPAEMVMQLQEWVNEIVNLRRTKNRNASLGLFKVRNGAGVTQQALSNLVSSGVIKLNDINNDFDNIRIDEAGEGSYRDEETAKKWAFEITSSYDSARGAPLPASASATATVIEDRNSKTAFVLIKEAIGLFQERWMNRHWMPHLPKLIKQEGLVKIFSDFEDIEDMRQRLVNALVMEEMDRQYKKTGYVPTEQELEQAINRADEKLRQDGDIFIETVNDIVAKNYDVKVVYTNEEMDVALTVQNLTTLAQMVPPGAQQQMIAQAIDLLGLEVPRELRVQMPQGTGMTPMNGPSGPSTPPLQTEQSLTTAANVTV